MANFSVSVVNVANRHNFSGGVAYVGRGTVRKVVLPKPVVVSETQRWRVLHEHDSPYTYPLEK